MFQKILLYFFLIFSTLCYAQKDPQNYYSNKTTMLENNCYSYACGRDCYFPRPGGEEISDHETNCQTLIDGAIRDGLIYLGCEFNDSYENNIVALAYGIIQRKYVINGEERFMNDYDFHFYKYHGNSCWSEKPGSKAPRWLSGNPEEIDRGSYTNFCGYFYVPKNISLKASPRPEPPIKSRSVSSLGSP